MDSTNEDVILVMKKQESTIYRRRDDLENPLASRLPITSQQWRQTIVSWMFAVTDQFQIRSNVVAAAAYYIDVSVEKLQITSPTGYQLLSMAALHLAIKLHDAISTAFPLSEFIKVANGEFEECDVIAMERKVISALDWHLHPPTPFCFVDAYFTLLPQSANDNLEVKFRIQETTERILQAALIENKFKSCQPSNVAYVAILLAMEQLGNHDMDPFDSQAFLSSIERFAHLSIQLIHVYQELEPLVAHKGNAGDPEKQPIGNKSSQSACTSSPSECSTKSIVISQELV